MTDDKPPPSRRANTPSVEGVERAAARHLCMRLAFSAWMTSQALGWRTPPLEAWSRPATAHQRPGPTRQR